MAKTCDKIKSLFNTVKLLINNLYKLIKVDLT